MYALVDCNNFYASCERLFRPDLYAKPIVVLSNNDGCVIARSNEAKVLGIQMGEPYFKIKDVCRQKQIHVFSSNYTLYGDLSHRVMSVIAEAWPDVEIYSIDEAFLDVSTHPSPETFCEALQKNILKQTGIPTSVGIGKTKTLAKLANFVAKKKLKTPVFDITHHEEWMSNIDVGDVWGVGRQWSKRLQRLDIRTAADLKNANTQWLKNTFNVVLQRTHYELCGQACLALEDVKPKKSIQSSRSFDVMQTEYQPLVQALSRHCAHAFESLRQQRLMTQHVSVFIQSNRFRPDLPQYSPSIGVTLVSPTDDLRRITKTALSCLKKIYQTGFHYKKMGLLLTDLSDNSSRQLDLFQDDTDGQYEKKERLMQVLGDINHRFGRQSLRLASQGWVNTPSMRADMKSPCYTTRWEEIPRVRAYDAC